MTYATTQRMLDRFGDAELAVVTNRNGGDTIDQAVLDAAMGGADELVNTYISGRYQLPIADPPGVLTDAACDIARFKLYKDDVPDAVRSRYSDALTFLKDLAAGRAKLDVAGVEPAAPVSGGVQFVKGPSMLDGCLVGRGGVLD